MDACGSAATTRFGSVLSYATGSMMVSMLLGSTPFMLRAKVASEVRDASSESVVIDRVAASAISKVLAGLPSRSCCFTSLSRAVRNIC